MPKETTQLHVPHVYVTSSAKSFHVAMFLPGLEVAVHAAVSIGEWQFYVAI